MANITPYVQRTQPQSGGMMPRASAPNVQQPSMFGMVADALGQLAVNQQKREDEQGRAWAIDAVSQARLQWASQLAESQATADPGAPNFTSDFIGKFDQYSSEALKNAPTESAKKYLHERLTDIRTSLGEKAITFEAGARVDYRDSQFNRAIDNGQKLMMTDPTQFEVSLQETLAVIDSSEMPPKERDAMRQKAISGIATAAVWSQIQKSPTAFMQSIGMQGGAGGAGAVNGQTGNKAFDILPFNDRVKMIGQALALNNSITSEADKAAEKLRKEKGDDMMKEAISRLSAQPGQPKLDRDFIEQARPFISPAEYKSLLEMHKNGGITGADGPKSDPDTFRHLQMLLRTDPESAQKEAFTAHANGHLSNSDLSSITQRAYTLDRQGGPKSTYERTRAYITGNLDPGPMVQDPVGRARMASAVNEFDKWMEGGKHTDAEIEARGEQIIKQWRFVNMKDTVAGFPQPRYGSVPRTGDPAAQIKAIANSYLLTKKAYENKQITKEEFMEESSRLNNWRKAIARGHGG